MKATNQGLSRRTALMYSLGRLAVVTAGGSILLGSATRVAEDVVNAELCVSAGERTVINGLVVPSWASAAPPAGRVEDEQRNDLGVGSVGDRGSRHRLRCLGTYRRITSLGRWRSWPDGIQLV